jgi:hypothetical protein
MWLCSRQSEIIQRLPLNLLYWLFSLACSPTTMSIDSKNSNDVEEVSLDPYLLSAKQGAYNTLCGLWSKQNGYPLQQGYVLTLNALPDQLREWFGSTFMVDKEEEGGNGDNYKETNNEQGKIIKISGGFIRHPIKNF